MVKAVDEGRVPLGGWGGSRGRNRSEIPKCAKSISDTNFEEPEESSRLEIQENIPATVKLEPTTLDIFCLFIDDDEVLEHLITATTSMLLQSERTQTTYKQFKRHPLTAEEVLGCLLLLSINSVRNYRQAWNSNSILHLVQLSQLLARECFEHIASLLHLVTPSEEAQLSQHRLKKILPFHQHAKQRCLEL